VDDNFHYMDEDERYRLSEFDDCTSAAEACRRIVDEFLATANHDCTSAELYHQYVSFGEDPWIRSDDPNCKFSAWTYARERCDLLAQKRDSS